MAATTILEGDKVQKLARTVEESTRSTREGVRFFIEPAPGTLARAKNKRHHIVFGRRGSGKSSLLAKVTEDLTIDRSPIAYVDLEEFKGHSYPDVLLSVLIKALGEFKTWLDTAALHRSTRTSFWKKFFGSSPRRGAFNKAKTQSLSTELGKMTTELNETLFRSEEVKRQTVVKRDSAGELHTALTTAVGGHEIIPVKLEANAAATSKASVGTESRSEYTSKKMELLHRNIMRYKQLFQSMAELADGPTFLLLDDLYHIRLSDQAQVLDYFHRIAKGSNLWIKVGTIRHRSRWYIFGDPPYGMKLGDDAEEIDLDVTLEKYDLTKRFLLKILENFAKEVGLSLDDFLTDGARDRLVLASGGVARDFDYLPPGPRRRPGASRPSGDGTWRAHRRRGREQGCRRERQVQAGGFLARRRAGRPRQAAWHIRAGERLLSHAGQGQLLPRRQGPVGPGGRAYW
jgi:hypothetical protein